MVDEGLYHLLLEGVLSESAPLSKLADTISSAICGIASSNSSCSSSSESAASTLSSLAAV